MCDNSLWAWNVALPRLKSILSALLFLSPTKRCQLLLHDMARRSFHVGSCILHFTRNSDQARNASVFLLKWVSHVGEGPQISYCQQTVEKILFFIFTAEERTLSGFELGSFRTRNWIPLPRTSRRHSVDWKGRGGVSRPWAPVHLGLAVSKLQERPGTDRTHLPRTLGP
jgi:hypothetical protein